MADVAVFFILLEAVCVVCGVSVCMPVVDKVVSVCVVMVDTEVLVVVNGALVLEDNLVKPPVEIASLSALSFLR